MVAVYEKNFHKKDAGYVFDIGMNSGFYTLLASNLGYPVVSLDPQPLCHEWVHEISHRTKISSLITQLNAGVGNGGSGGMESEGIEVHLNKCHGGYSWPDKWAGKTKRVPMVPLKDIVGDRHVLVMKMDTEGNELYILATGVQLFENKQVDYLFVETKQDEWKRRKMDTTPLIKIAALATRILDLSTQSEITAEQLLNGKKAGDYLLQFNGGQSLKPDVRKVAKFNC